MDNNNKFMTASFLRKMNDESFNNAMEFFSSMKAAADELMEENDKLKERSNEDIFKEKNEEIKRLKAELNKKNYYESYYFSGELIKTFDAWYKEHLNKAYKNKDMTQFKNSGHHVSYVITPSEVGWFYSIKCSCGAYYQEMD